MKISRITSKENTVVKDLIRIKKNPSPEAFVLEGDKFIKDVDSKAILSVFSCEEISDSLLSSAKDASFYIVSPAVMNKISGVDSVGHTVCVVKAPSIPLPDRILVADGVQDPGNAGTIIRSAKAFGFGVVFSKDSANPFSEKVVRSSAGTVLSCPILCGADIEVFIKEAKGKYTFIAADMHGVPLKKAERPISPAIIIGNEGRGISASVMALCNKTVAIEMNEGVESLNAAVAASLMMYSLG